MRRDRCSSMERVLWVLMDDDLGAWTVGPDGCSALKSGLLNRTNEVSWSPLIVGLDGRSTLEPGLWDRTDTVPWSGDCGTRRMQYRGDWAMGLDGCGTLEPGLWNWKVTVNLSSIKGQDG